MANMGMQMPGGRASSGKASPDVFTGLMFVAVLALIAATALVGIEGSKVAPDGMPWQLQPADGEISLPSE